MDFKKIRVYGKIRNLEHPGKDIKLNVNAEGFNYRDGDIVDVPTAVVEAIKSAVKIRWKQVGNQQVKEEVPRFVFIPTERPKKSEEEQKTDELINELLESEPKAKMVKK